MTDLQQCLSCFNLVLGASDIPNDASDSKLPDRVVFYRDMTRALIEERETFPGWQKNSPARLRNIPYGHDDGMAGNHHSSHNGPLLLRPLPLPGDLPRVQARYAGQIPLRQLVPGKPFDEYGFISEDQLDFAAPETYIRWVQPIESELDKQVEYDMDSLDTEWLELYNTERSKRGEEPVPAEVFEIIMDRLEKEWFDLNSRIPKIVNEASDGICEICDDGEAEQSNAIVFCDGCNLSVHQDCYGVPYIPADQWLCRKCTVSPYKPVSCVLCPNEGGAFKQTTSGTNWAHLLCALFIPEVGVCNSVYMEPIDGIELIQKGRWKLTCYLCKQRIGACMQCHKTTCTTSFHATCAREYGLTLELIKSEDSSECKGWCHRHTPMPQSTEELDAATPTSADSRLSQSQTSRPVRQHRFSPPPPERRLKGSSNQAYAKSFVSQGPPIIPETIASSVLSSLSAIKFKRKKETLSAICRFWSLKRESRRGAGFLKRLHLEPWTAKAQRGNDNSEIGAKKLEYMKKLRRDLENVRMLCEQVKKRERLKQRRVDEARRTIEPILFPVENAFWEALDEIGALDKDDIFLEPVSRTIAPDYFDIIKKPVDWLTIGNRIQKHHYLSVEAFKEDIRLVFANAVRYNKPDTVFNRAAQRLAVMAEPILAKLDNWTSAEKQAEQAILMALLTQDRINSLFDLGEDLSLFDEGDRPKMLQLDDVSGTPLLTPQDDRPRRAKNKKQRQAEQKAEHELQAKLEREAIEQVRREAEQTAREAEEAARLAEEQRRQAEVEEAKRQEEEAERLKAEKKAAQRERDRQAKQAKKEKERIAKEKKRESNRRRKEERRRAAESRAAGPSPPQPKQTEKRQTRGDAKGKGQGQEDEIQKASSPTGAKMSDMSELSELSEMSDLDDQPPTSPDRQMSIQISPKPLITQFSSRQSASTPPAASKVQSDRRKSTSATKPMEMDPPPGQDTVTSGKSRKRAREESPPPSAQLLKKKKKRFEVDAPSDDQLEAIRVPELPEGTMAEHKARLGELKAQFSCRNKELRDGDQVWALISGFPSWPAQVVVDEGLVPAGSTDAVPVVFFDEGRQRGQVKTTNLHILGEDSHFDALMMHYPVVKGSKSKPLVRKQLAVAYRSAKWNWQERESSEE